MKKKAIARGLLGAPLGIAIGYVVTIIISAFFGNGRYLPVKPELVDFAGGEIEAVVLQLVLCMIMGAGFGAASTVWEMESWSLAKQTGVYFAAACLCMFPISYFAYWMPHTAAGVLEYIGIFLAIFLIVWLVMYFSIKSKIRKMNESIND